MTNSKEKTVREIRESIKAKEEKIGNEEILKDSSDKNKKEK
jgi:hypothetical protein